ncbi:hypothetical protein BFJ70_g3148 [Fusarium oxysporum]|nr:hypothetical protein BFJ70_g3148 [Fusarium oxysporum]
MASPLATLTLPHLPGHKSSVTYPTLHHVAKIAANKSRAARNALYRHVQFLNSIPEDAKTYHKGNREAQGLPRAFSIRFTDPTVGQDSPELKKLNGQTLIIGKHGSSDAVATNSYSFQARIQAAAGEEKTDVGAFINLLGTQASGVLGIGDRSFNIQLDPVKVWFDVNISMDAGAYFSTGNRALKWDTTSSNWKSATWETAGLTFGYNTKNIGDELQPRWAAENTFIDNSASPSTSFDLAASPMTYGSQYTSIMSTDGSSGPTMVTLVVEPPPAPPSNRANKTVKSVFPTLWQVQFSPWGDSFDGAYRDANGNIYAVSGTVKLDDDVSLVTMLSAASKDIPLENVNPGAEEVSEPISTPSRMGETITANGKASKDTCVDDAEVVTLGQTLKKSMVTDLDGDGPPLQVYQLLTLNPMVPDSTSSSGWRDSVAELAMRDFHDLIIYFMDPDLRTTFVQSTTPSLPADVLAVANDDGASGTGENKTFYQKLQVPYIVSMLASSRTEKGQYCNGRRADAQLRSIPTDDPVYKRHSAKLYRAHYRQKFSTIDDFLRDQNSTDYSDKMNAFAAKMKSNIAAKSADLKDPSNPNYEAQLAATQKDIDGLVAWAKERSLYWALQLLYYVQNSALPNWYSQYTSGVNTNMLSMMQKQLNALFGLLENNQVNTAPGGRNFMEAYNDDMRLFQMAAIIPTLIDASGNSQEIDNLIAQCLDQYIQHFKASPDEKHIEALEAANELYKDRELRARFWLPLADLSRLGSAASSWQQTMSLWENTVKEARWFKNLAFGGKLLTVFQAATAAIFILMPLIPGQWDQLSESQKWSWGLSMAGLSAMLIVKIAQGLIRFRALYSDISGFLPSLKCILGFESVVDAIPDAAERIQGSWAKFFTRTSKQTLAMQEREVWFKEIMAANEPAEFSKVERMMGRNMGEIIGTVAGLAMAAASIVMAAIDLGDQKEELLITMDIIMITSSVIQILAVVAGWITVAGAAAESGIMATLASYSAVSLCATWGGPVSIVFAIIGIIIFIIWFSNQDHRDPTQKFLDEQAEQAGLRMRGDKQAPEYFGVVPAAENNPSLVGLGIRGPLVSVKPYLDDNQQEHLLKVTEAQQQYIKLDTDNKVPIVVEKIDFSMNTVWSLETGPDGKSFIYTAAFTQNTDDSSRPVGTTRKLWYLGTSDDKTQVVYRELPSIDQPQKRQAVLPHILWVIDVLTKPDQDEPDTKDSNGVVTKPGKVVSAVVGISQGGAKLGRWVNRETLQIDSGLAVAQDADANKGHEYYPDKMLCATWAMTMYPIGPSDFKYQKQKWTIYDTDTDTRNMPRFQQPGTFSGGLKWTIDPALPTGVFELVQAAGQDEGIIRQVEGKRAPLMQCTTYQVSCSLNYKGVASGTRITQVEIQVIPGRI